MTDRPIIFSGPMIRAIIDGRKSMTRRVLKPQPVQMSEDSETWGYWPGIKTAYLGSQRFIPAHERLPYAPGDRLYVREAWRPIFLPGGCEAIEWRADQGWLAYDRFIERTPDGLPDIWRRPSLNRWRPSIHMPRWASRLTLVVTDVRVQRVREISEEDAWAEGVRPPVATMSPAEFSALCSRYGAEGGRAMFAHLWHGLNAKRGYGWDANPWVVALTFTVHHQNIDRMGAI